MNERIKEIAKQAGLWRQHYDIGEESPARLKMFAELIVKECTGICDELQTVPATEPRHCAEDIRIFFGVEE